jgi:eukaryotic-like serine/threonine-protein kinase
MLKQVEKYEIVGEIGRGGMATVYRALDTRLHRMVALKLMHPHLQGAKEARQRFAREALTIARLRHPSILEIYDYSGEESQTSFIATELLTGPNLKQFSESHAEIPAEMAACIAIQIARALAAAHAEGIVHRDAKPENVMLHEDRCVKLTDFGIAQLIDVQGMTTTGQVLGSPAHMPPEQIEGKEVDPRSDLFSLGTVLYMLATSELPFSGSNPHQVLKRIMEGKYRDPLQVRPSIGAQLAAIIRRLLELDPADRYQSANDLERDLTRFVADVGIDAPDETLAEYLRGPDEFAAAFRQRCIDRLTQLGEDAQRAGAVPAACDYYNRVLALDDGNLRVLTALQRLGRRSALRRAGAYAAAGCALVCAVGAALYYALEPGLVPRSQARSSTSVVSGSSGARPEVAPPAAAVDPQHSSPSEAATGSAGAAAPVPNRQPERAHAVASPPAVASLRKVAFNPYPANVSIQVDGQAPRPFGPSFREIELLPGTHRFKFVGAHDCCIDHEMSVRIPAGASPFPIAPRLKFRPAGLYVVTDTPANVSVDEGRVSGRSRSVIRVSNLAELIEIHRIRVSADGHRDHTQDVRLQAGQVITVEVAMKNSGS